MNTIDKATQGETQRREIKFRGKRVNNGEWVYGYLLGGRFGDNDRKELYICHGVGAAAIEVAPASVGQFIGSKDKKGKEIYEGDLVKVKVSDNPSNVCQGLIAENKVGKEVIGYIDWAQLYCQFRFTTNEITYLDLCCGAREIEIIGNIYADPEPLSKIEKENIQL